MKTFLENVAQDIINKYGTDLSNLVVVFPNKRASLFLNDQLARLAGRPVWSPRSITISQLFRQHATLEVGDRIRLVCQLYQVYQEITQSTETLDHFYSWGELMLGDFEDVDKNMADANKVFANLRDYHELDTIDYLSEDQREMLQQFFATFTDNQESILQERFLRLWSNMGNIYHTFRRRLAADNLCYEGALYRSVVEDFKAEEWSPGTQYLFVGFNFLQQVEQRLFRLLKDTGQAHFYWDFDRSYLSRDSEAGRYIGQHLEAFPNELPIDDDSIYNLMNAPKDIHFVAAKTENVQARYVTQWLQQGTRIKDGKRTAVVMCNEQLLPTITHCLPREVKRVNVTTGYPLGMTPVYALIHGRMDRWLRRRSLTNAELTDRLLALIKKLSTAQQDALQQESYFRMYTLLQRLQQLITDGILNVVPDTFRRLVSQLVQTTSIPFHGEPAVGLQVMGVLETRNLDFDHLLILSCNEGYMPKGVNDASFIPHSIRKAYGLTTVENKVAIYAYYFSRLLQRTTDITITYNAATQDGHLSEMSRFMLQLMVEGHHTIKHHVLTTDISSESGDIVTVSEEPTYTQPEQDEDGQNLYISPSAINNYLRCPRKYYFRHLQKIEEPDADEDEFDARQFGNVFHCAMQLIYTPFEGSNMPVTADYINDLLKHPAKIELLVDQAFDKEVFNGRMRYRKGLNGLQLINRRVIISYIKYVLAHEVRHTPFHILMLEKRLNLQVSLPDGRIVETGGIIDRLDAIKQADGTPLIRVIDYKTGTPPKKHPNGLDDIFVSENIDNCHTDYYLQTMIYACAVQRQERYAGKQVAPALLFMRSVRQEDYDPILKLDQHDITDISIYQEAFTKKLNILLQDIFRSDNQFEKTTKLSRCEKCPYRKICY